MFNTKKLTLLFATVALAIGYAGTASASLTFSLFDEFSGGQEPAGPPPWATATFEQAGANTVNLTLDTSGLQGTEFISEWLFNFNPDKDLSSLSIALSDGTDINNVITINKGEDAFKADGDGSFDIQFVFANALANRFGAGETVVIQFTLAGLVEADFDFQSVGGPVGKTGFETAAHVQGLADGGSGWITVPEPNGALLAALSLFGTRYLVRRRRR